MTEKKDYTRRITNEIRLKGFKIIRLEPNPNRPEFNIYVFQSTPELESAFKEIVERQEVTTNMTKFQTAPNQKVVRVEKYPVESNENYAKISIEAMMAAAKDLDGNVFKLWCYFAKNKDIFTFALSNAAAKEQFGMTYDVYDKTI